MQRKRECIAVYNACDGIPQCSDGSDEAVELDCPTMSGLTHPKTFHDQLKNLKTLVGNSTQEGYVLETTVQPEIVQQLKQPIVRPQSSQKQQQAPSFNYFSNAYSRQKEQIPEPKQVKIELPQQMASQPRYYGREGEMMQYPMGGAQWQAYQPQRQDESNHAFSHKNNGVINENPDSQIPLPYNNEMSHADYMKYAAAATNNGYYSNSGPVYYPGPNGWMHRYPQQPRGLDDIPQRPMLSMYGNVMSGPLPSDYYYEDSQLRGRYPQVPQDLRKTQNSDSYYYSNQRNNFPNESEKLEVLKENGKEDNPKKTESVKKTLENPPTTAAEILLKQNATTTTTTTTTKVIVNRPHPTSVVAEHLKMSETDMKDVDGINQKPSGAILSLTLGMCITAIMITLVGCRLRVVRKRMRRNGKSPFAHDADFLVNGMYL